MFQKLVLLVVSCLLLVTATSAADESSVYLLPQLPVNLADFDQALQVGRLTAGDINSYTYQVVRIPVSKDLQPMMSVPGSDILTRLLSSLASMGIVPKDGDIYLDFAFTTSFYTVTLSFESDVQTSDGQLLRKGSVISSDGQAIKVFAPVVLDFPVTTILVDSELNAALPDAPIGNFFLANVNISDKRDEYRIVAVYLNDKPYVWLTSIERRPDEQINGDRNQYTGSPDRSPKVHTPVIHTVRTLALMPLEERLQMWLDGNITWNETNCFILEGECYRQGYNGELYGPGPFQLLIGTFLGANQVDGHFIVYVGFTAQDGQRYFVPFDAGTYEAANGFGIVVYDTPTLGQPGDMSIIVPWREEFGIDAVLNSYIGSPTDIALLTGNLQAGEAEFTEYVENLAKDTSQEERVAQFVFGVTVGGQEPIASFVNIVIENSDQVRDLTTVASMIFGRYV